MSKIAIIPARGGSKRIPRKNIRNFLDKPIISYSIKAAIESELFDEVMVSTDDEEIAEISKKYGAEVPFLRSKKNSKDNSGISEVVLEVLSDYEKNGEYFDAICCILATSPFVTPEMLSNAFDILNIEDCDSVFTIQKFPYPYQRGLEIQSNKAIQMKWPNYLKARSQDLEELYHDAGQFYISSVEKFKEEKKFFMKNSRGILISDLDARDIDTEQDWRVAEKLFKLKYIEGNSC